MNWTQTLLSWYAQNKRSFLWRETKDPYKIWLSEIILQQTRTSQGLPYYERFLTEFPKLKDLALASEGQVLKLWQGLGYYSRARNLHATAQYVNEKLEGKFPVDFNSLLALKGVGDYTASAIGSICYDLPEAVVDGNVYRLLSRYFGIKTPIDASHAHKEFKTKAMSLMDKTQPGTFNQAMMEFGALQCSPKKPSCESCPFAASCVAFTQNKISLLPVKKGKQKVKNRYFNYLVIRDSKGNTFLEKRIEKGIWQNLFQFPLIETSTLVKSKKKLVAQTQNKMLLELNSKEIIRWNKEPILHQLSHQKLHVFFWIISSQQELENALTIKELKNHAVPVVIQNFIENFFTIES